MKDNARTRRASGTTQDGGDRSAQYNPGASANTARPHVGEIVEVDGLPGRFVVTAVDDPALITLKSAQGVTLRVGERQVMRLGVVE